MPIVADGGIVTGGDICKCIACGADAVMIGSPIARSAEAPGRGFHWGLAPASPAQPGARARSRTLGGAPLAQVRSEGPMDTPAVFVLQMAWFIVAWAVAIPRIAEEERAKREAEAMRST